MKKFSLLIFALLLSHFVFATQHVIMFGGKFGAAYSPINIVVNVGDSIVWEGDFSTFPLSSYTVPDGAYNFSNNYASVFVYVVMVEGEYDYECQPYFTEGMTGRFTATNVSTSTLALNTSRPFYIVQEQGLNILYSSYNGNKVSDFVLNIFDETGRMVVGTTISPYNSRYVLPQLPSGIYIVRLADDQRPLFASQIWQP